MKNLSTIFVIFLVVQSCFAYNTECSNADSVISDYAESFDNLITISDHTSQAFSTALKNLMLFFCQHPGSAEGQLGLNAKTQPTEWSLYVDGKQLYYFDDLDKISAYYSNLSSVNMSRQIISDSECSGTISTSPITYNATLVHRYIASNNKWTISIGDYNLLLNYQIYAQSWCIVQYNLNIDTIVQINDATFIGQYL
jgi:hypothetical protein